MSGSKTSSHGAAALPRFRRDLDLRIAELRRDLAASAGGDGGGRPRAISPRELIERVARYLSTN